jgi:hypothetical protein
MSSRSRFHQIGGNTNQMLKSTTHTFRATPGIFAMWVGLFGIPVPFVIMDFATLGWTAAVSKNLDQMLVAALLPPIAAAIWLLCFRLTINPESVGYRALGARTVLIPISDITSVTASRVTPISRVPTAAYVSLKDGSRVLVNLKVFPSEAATALLSLTRNI